MAPQLVGKCKLGLFRTPRTIYKNHFIRIIVIAIQNTRSGYPVFLSWMTKRSDGAFPVVDNFSADWCKFSIRQVITSHGVKWHRSVFLITLTNYINKIRSLEQNRWLGTAGKNMIDENKIKVARISGSTVFYSNLGLTYRILPENPLENLARNPGRYKKNSETHCVPIIIIFFCFYKKRKYTRIFPKKPSCPMVNLSGNLEIVLVNPSSHKIVSLRWIYQEIRESYSTNSKLIASRSKSSFSVFTKTGKNNMILP